MSIHQKPSIGHRAGFLHRVVAALAASLVVAGLPSPARGLDAPVAPAGMELDGVLREWGGAGTVALDPGGREIGLRGVFTGPDDHQADVFVMWDARHLYVAAAVRDDSLDAQPVRPAEREWGSGRSRKDRMFYYDHLKIFVRGPGADVGTNLWVAPVVEAGRAYAWGGTQRQEPGEDMEAVAASVARWPVYTYEVALPWSWLEVHPEPDMVLDGLLLVTDSDRPGAEVGEKIAGGDAKWIWWQGEIVLRGQPEGWQPAADGVEQPGEPQEARRDSAVSQAVAPGAAEARAQAARIQEAVERVRALRLAEARADSALRAAAARPVAPVAAGDRGLAGDPSSPAAQAVSPANDSAATATARRYSESMRAVLTRAARGPQKVSLPEWIYQQAADSSLTVSQVDSFVVILTRTLSRLVRERTNGRVDYFVIDMAEGGQARRDQARTFLRSLIARYMEQLDQPASVESQRLDGAAQAAEVPPEAARELVLEVARRAQAVYAEGKATTTSELVRQGQRHAHLTAAQAQAFLDALLGAE